LDVPIGTVKSRMARGIAQLQDILTRGEREGHSKKQND
jgi:DNA-directed RNA polymerase specialized sigma24 family protein